MSQEPLQLDHLDAEPTHHRLLHTQIGWFVRLRWLAGGAIILAGLMVKQWASDEIPGGAILWAGLAVLAYNTIIWSARTRRLMQPDHHFGLLVVAWLQTILDLFCLSFLAAWTGGWHSPLLGFFILHMVFASLLLRQTMAWSAAVLSGTLFATALWMTNQWSVSADAMMHAAGWGGTLLLTVYVANRITRNLRDQHRRAIIQNRHVRHMTERFKEQQRAMVQHEKMVATGQMAAGIAHEIANPLASMDSVLQLMERHPNTPRPNVVRTLREQVDRMNLIVKQMSEFAHQAEPRWETVALNDVIQGALRLIRFDHRIRRVTIESRLGDQVGSLPLMPQAVQQVLVNLIINALDAMADVNEPQITITSRRESDDIIIQIADNGCGMDSETLDRIFEPFFTTKPVGKGTGLGLAISYTIIEKHGGRLNVESHLGAGTTFFIHFPKNGKASSSEREPESAKIPQSEKSPL